VGLTPEILPMIVTSNIARRAIAMSDKKMIFKNSVHLRKYLPKNPRHRINNSP
jgi:hypothetical protein